MPSDKLKNYFQCFHFFFSCENRYEAHSLSTREPSVLLFMSKIAEFRYLIFLLLSECDLIYR
jgi:hypothetical protein